MRLVDRYTAIQERRHAGEGGFTLIELLIVIVVLGILAAVVVFALGGVTGTSTVAACNADAKTVSTAVSAFLAQNPGGAPVLSASGNLINGGYLKSLPGNSSYYTVSLGAQPNYYVEIALTSNDSASGGSITNGAGTAPGTTAQPYEGPNAFTWLAGNNAGMGVGSNICASA